ncbi:LysR family transcriptional regulator, partial [Pseudomonas aeruginosa]
MQQCRERTPGRTKDCTLRMPACLYFHSMHLPDLNLLVALNVLLEEGSVVGAARRMHLS